MKHAEFALLVLSFIVLGSSLLVAQDTVRFREKTGDKLLTSTDSIWNERYQWILIRAQIESKVSYLSTLFSFYHQSLMRWPQTPSELRDYEHNVGVSTDRIPMDSILNRFRNLTFNTLDSDWCEIKYDSTPFSFDSVSVETYAGTLQIGPNRDQQSIGNLKSFRAIDLRTNRRIDIH
ncbi:MAG TPA: hypothetical protein VF393_08530 [archaeon]